MNNVILIGNGFDLSHNLKTKYSHFLESIPENEFHFGYKTVPIRKQEGHKIVRDGEKTILVPNKLYERIKTEPGDLWCDIERVYFSELMSPTVDIELLNKEFSRIKTKLEGYLSKESKNCDKISCYEEIFSRFSEPPLVVNFNYTNTAELYDEHIDELIYIHGKLYEHDNPIVFGYAATDDEAKSLLDKNNDRYLKNIKQYEYLGAYNFTRVFEHLDYNEDINIHLMGLSCGLSDRLILKKIFSHPNVKYINNYYFEGRSNHLRKLMNVNRIIGQETGFKKFRPITNCLPMPQYGEKLRIDVISEYFEENRKYGL